MGSTFCLSRGPGHTQFLPSGLNRKNIVFLVPCRLEIYTAVIWSPLVGRLCWVRFNSRES